MHGDNDIYYMRRALELAEKARGRTNPNPMVGAVIVKNGEIVGEGYHIKAGTPHAEIHALNAAGSKAEGAEVYVTLEPCSHYGKTPPCAEALIRAGVSKVFIATLDPNPQVSGNGAEKLRQAGIAVEIGLLAQEAQRLNEVFFKYIKKRIPFVLLKTAMTLDGKIATYTGDSRWISGEKSRNYVHQLRDQYDAILVGIGTVLKDDPMLNTRLDKTDTKNPVRIILDGGLEIPMESKIVKTSREQPTIIFCNSNFAPEKSKALLAAGIEIIVVEAEDDNNISLSKILEILGEREICSLIVEGGGEIYASFLLQGLVDKVCWFISPKILGGKKAPSPVGGQGVSKIKDAIMLKDIMLKNWDQDICLEAYVDNN